MLRFLAFAAFLNVIHAQNPVCPPGFFYQNGLKMCVMSSGPASWNSAGFLCSRSGGNLISVHNAPSNSLYAGLQYDLNNDNRGWLGVLISNGAYQWTDGSPFDYSNFRSNVTNCAYLDALDLVWKGADCTVQLPFLCAVPPIVTTMAPQTTPTTANSNLSCLPVEQQPLYTCQQGWQNWGNASYLMFFDMTFVDGEASCVSQGGHLASVHSKAENDFITGLCCMTKFGTSNQDGHFATILTGAVKINGAGSWTDGTPYDYESRMCEDEGNGSGHVVIIDYDQEPFGGQCAYGDWIVGAANPGEYWPYLVCKK